MFKKITLLSSIYLLALIFVLPTLWMVNSSLKGNEIIYRDLSSIWAFIPNFLTINIDAYKELLNLYNIFRNILNSLLYASITVVFGLLINSLAGYSLAQFRYPFKGFFLIFIISLMIVPIESTILQLYLVVNNFGLVNTVVGFILPFVVNVMNIFLFRQYFLSFPRELKEAAYIDGMGQISIFARIVLPISITMYVTVGIITFLASWNDFLWPIMALTESKMMPIQVALNGIFSDRDKIFTNHTMAALTISTVPVIILYTLFQRYIVEGLSRSGIK